MWWAQACRPHWDCAANIEIAIVKREPTCQLQDVQNVVEVRHQCPCEADGTWIGFLVVALVAVSRDHWALRRCATSQFARQSSGRAACLHHGWLAELFLLLASASVVWWQMHDRVVQTIQEDLATASKGQGHISWYCSSIESKLST